MADDDDQIGDGTIVVALHGTAQGCTRAEHVEVVSEKRTRIGVELLALRSHGHGGSMPIDKARMRTAVAAEQVRTSGLENPAGREMT